MEQEQVQGGDPLKDAITKLRSAKEPAQAADPLSDALNRMRSGKSTDKVDRTAPPFTQAPSAPMVSPSTSVAGSSPAGSGAGQPKAIQPVNPPRQQVNEPPPFLKAPPAPMASPPAIIKDKSGREFMDYTDSLSDDPLVREFVSLTKGKKYKLGAKGTGNISSLGSTTDQEVDCSGAMCAVVNKFRDKAYDPLYTSAATIASKSKPLKPEEASRGDYVFMRTGGKGVDHIGMLITDTAGRKYIAESSSSFNGPSITLLQDRIDSLKKSSPNLIVEYGRDDSNISREPVSSGQRSSGGSPAGPGAGQTKPKFVPRELPLDLIGASRITQEPDMASVAVDQTNTFMTPGEQEFRKEFAPMDLAAVKEFKKKIPQKMQLIQQQQAGLEADKKALEEARVQLESDLAQAQQQMAENPAIAPQLQAQHQADVDRYNQMVASANKQAESIKDLARSVEADYQKADLQEYNLKSKQGGFLGASHNAIVEGVLSMASVFPEISIDLIAGLTPESMLPTIDGEAGKSRDQLAKEWKREIIPAFKEAGMNLWRSGTTEEYEAEMNKGLFGRSWLGLMKSSTAMATPMMSGIFLQVYAEAKEEMRGEEWDGVPEGEKNAMAALLALPATALERMGFSNLAANNPFVKQLLARSLASLPKNATKEQIEAVINAETTDAVMNYVIRSAGSTISEAETGGVQYITDVAIKDMFNRFLGEDGKFELPKSWGEYAQGTVMSMADEGMGGLIMGQIPALAAARRAKKNVGEVTTDTQFELLEETLKNPEYLPMMQEQLNRQVESGKISKVQADDTISAWKESQQIVSKIPEDLPTEKRREAFDLLTQKAKLAKMDKALVGDKIAAIDAKLMKLAGVEPTAKEGDVKTEAPAPPQAPVPVSPEVRDEILRARQELGVDFDPLEDLPESVVITFGRVEDNIPVSAVDIEAASSWMYKKYKDVMSMRNDPNRLLTLDQIDSYAAQLGADIELLENHKQKLRDESEGVGAAQAANTKGATAPVSGTQATETKPQGRVAPTATQDQDSAKPKISWGAEVSLGRDRNGDLITQWEESDASKNPQTGKYRSENVQVLIEQHKDGYSVIVAPSIGDGKFLANKGASKDGFATAQEAEDHALRMIEAIEGRKKPQAPASTGGQMTVKSFADDIAAGKKMDSPEAVQFYENNKKEIEAELQRMAGPQKQAPQQAPVDPNDDAEITIDEEVADDPDALLEEAMGVPREVVSDEDIDAEMAKVSKATGAEVVGLDQDEYTEAVDKVGGDISQSLSGGFFMGRNGKIYINRDRFRRGVVAHEGTHAIIFNALLSGNPNGKAIISSSAKQALESSPKAKEALIDFLGYYGGAKKKEDGTVDIDATIADEGLAEEVMSEFVASIYNGTIKLDNAMRQFIRDMYNRIMAALGVSTKVEFKEDGDFIAAAKQIASAMKAGRKIETGKKAGGSGTGAGSKFSRLAARTPGTKARPYDHNLAAVDPAAVDMDAMSDKALNKAADMLAKYPGMRIGSGSAKTRIAKAIDRMVGNILYLHDSFPEDVRKLAKEWYVGANKVSLEWAKTYGVTPAQTAGVIAALSPQKDWFTNMSLAERVLDFVTNHRDHKWDSAMSDRAQKIKDDYTDKIGKAKKSLAKNPNNDKKRKELRSYESAVEKLDIAIPRISGKVYSDLTSGNDKAWFLRIWDEANNDPSFNQYLPTGEKTVIQRNKAPKPTKKNPDPVGVPSKIAWQNAKSIAAAIDIAENGTSIDVVSRGIGEAHKVRSFYNNIFDPSSPDFTTIDTHAMAAAMFLPLSGSSPITTAGFGGLSDSASGHSGLYPIYQRAYEIAAKQRGLLPREMQSITWEAVRGLFEKGQKAGAGSSASDVWKAMPSDPDGARAAVSDLFGGISTPGWMGSELQEADKPKFSKRQPDGSLNGLPRKFKVGGKEMEASHWKPAEDVAISYMKKAGLPYNPPSDYVEVDPDRAKRIADEYEKMKHDPENPEVAADFDALDTEVLAQYDEIIEKTGLDVEIMDPLSADPYNGNPWGSTVDIRDNNHVWVYPSDGGYGPFVRATPSDFSKALEAARASMGAKDRGQVSSLPKDFKGRLFLYSGGKAGFGIADDGELIGLFKSAGGPSGMMDQALQIGKGLGGTHLWAFDTYLASSYAKRGAKETERIKWNDEYAPSGWDKSTMGTPDVVRMDLDGVKDLKPLQKTGRFAGDHELTKQELFRMVHDYFGHVKEGVGFRANGEENAWRAHSSMLTPPAQRALTTLTRGQNSWVNYGPYGEKNRTAKSGETVYADQKIGLMPMWVSEDGRNDSVSEADKPKFSKATPGKNRVPQEHRDNLTDDGKGNYVFFHKGPAKLKGGKIDPAYFGTGKTKDNRSNPVMNYYTKPDQGERMIKGDVTYAVPVPKWKVYPLMSDPLDLYDKAEANFRKKFGKDQAFDAVRQADFIGPLAEKAGFDMMIAGWSMYPLRAESGKSLAPDAKLTKKYEEEGVVDLTKSVDPYYEKLMAKARADRDKQNAKEAKGFGGPKFSKKTPAEVRAGAEKVKAMTNEDRDNYDPSEDDNYEGYSLYEAEKLVPKPTEKPKRVTDSNSFNLWSDWHSVINVDGVVYGLTKYEDPDAISDEEDSAGFPKEYVWAYARMDDQLNVKSTVTNDVAELVSEIKGSSNIKFSGASPENIAKALIAKGYNTKAKAREYMVSKGADRMVDQVMAEFDKLRDAAAARKAAPPKQAPQKPVGEGVKKTFAGQRVYEGSFRDEVREEVRKLGLFREVESRAEAREKAKKLIESVGIDAAVDAVRNKDMEGGAAAFVWDEALRQLDNEIAESTDPTTHQELVAKQAEMVQEIGDMQLAAGRFNSAWGDILKNSDLGYHSEKKAKEWEDKFGERPSKEIMDGWRKRDEKLAELKKKIDAAEKREEEAQAKEAIQSIAESVIRENNRKKSGKYSSQAKRMADQFRTLKTKPIVILDADGNPINITKLGSALPFDWNELIEVGAKAIEKTGQVADAVTAMAEKLNKQKWFSSLDDRNKMAVMSQLEDAVKGASEGFGNERVKVPVAMIRNAVAAGIRDIDMLVSVIKEQIKDRYPDASDREIRDAITGYGKVVNMSKDEISVAIRRMKDIGRVASALEDIEKKMRPMRSGLQRDKLDAEQRALHNKLRDAMRDLPMDQAENDRVLKTALEAAKTRARNRIEDLQREIDTKERAERNQSGIVPDSELAALIKERDMLKEEHDRVFGKRVVTEEMRVKSALDSIRRSIDEYERRIADNELDPKKPTPVRETPELKIARQNLSKLRDDYKKLQDEAGVVDRRRTEAAKKATKKRIAELERRVADQDFSKKPVRKTIADDELTILRAEKERIKEQYDADFYKEMMRNRTTSQRLGDAGWEAWGVLRAVQSTLDLSFVLLQGGALTVSNMWRRPDVVASAFKNMFTAMNSEKKSEDWLRKIKAQPWYDQAKEAKLAITQPHAELTGREELFMSDWTRIAWAIAGSPLLLKSRAAHDKWVAANPFRALERGASAYLDTLRVERYLEGVKMLEARKADINGKEVTTQDYKDVADVVNTLTGRASLGALEGFSKGLTRMFYSPRMWASAIKTGTPYGLYHFGKMTPTARKMAVLDMGRFIGTTMGVVTLAAIALAGDDDDETYVETDPRSSDFGKIRLGDIRIDPWGGRVQQAVAMTRMTIGGISLFMDKPIDAYKRGDKTMPLGKGFGTPTMFDVGLTMAMNKLSPSASFLVEAARTTIGKDGKRYSKYDKDPYVFKDEFNERLMPLYVGTVGDLMQEDPGALEGFLSFYGLLGGGISVYGKKPKAKARPTGTTQRPARVPRRPE